MVLLAQWYDSSHLAAAQGSPGAQEAFCRTLRRAFESSLVEPYYGISSTVSLDDTRSSICVSEPVAEIYQSMMPQGVESLPLREQAVRTIDLLKVSPDYDFKIVIYE